MKDTITAEITHHESKIPRSIFRAMDGAKKFLNAQLFKVPWLWRLDPTGFERNQILKSDTLRTYGRTVREQINVSPLHNQILTRSFFVKFQVIGKKGFNSCYLTGSICVDCGSGWVARETTKEEEYRISREVCWANVALGVFLCSEYVLFFGLMVGVQYFIRKFSRKLFRRVHSSKYEASLRLVLCLEWDTHYWREEDIIKCAQWGNYSAQRLLPYIYSSDE
jgi:hypothetical protein